MGKEISVIYSDIAPYCKECDLLSKCIGVCGASKYFEGLKGLIQDKKKTIENNPYWQLGPPNYGSLRTLKELLEAISSQSLATKVKS